MKNIIRALFFVLFIFIITPYSLQCYGLRKLNNSLSTSMTSFETYQKGWNYLDYSKYFPFWRKKANKHQESCFLQAQMRFFEDRIACQIGVERKIKDWLEKNLAMQNDSLSRNLEDTFFEWKQKGEAIGSLPPKLQQKISAVHKEECMPIKEKWFLFLNWVDREGKEDKLLYQNQIPSRIFLEEQLLQFKLDYNVNYLTKGY